MKVLTGRGEKCGCGGDEAGGGEGLRQFFRPRAGAVPACKGCLLVLYNHISSIDDVNRAIGTHAAAQLNGALERAAEGKKRDAALYALADEYRMFVRENYELYRAIIGLPLLDEDGAAQASV